MVKTSIKERRNFSRAKRVLSIQYRLVNKRIRVQENGWQLSMTEDMSVGGLTFYSDQELRIGDVLELKVAMSGILDIYTGLSKVVRVERKKTGAYYFIAVQYIEDQSTRRAKTYIPAKKSKNRI